MKGQNGRCNLSNLEIISYALRSPLLRHEVDSRINKIHFFTKLPADDLEESSLNREESLVAGGIPADDSKDCGPDLFRMRATMTGQKRL